MTPATSTVLILSGQPLVAALLGMLLELLGYQPVFAEPGERPEDAVGRARATFVLLLDQELDAAKSDLFFARAAQRQLPIAVFGVRSRADHLATLARERGVPWFAMPIDLEGLARAVELAASAQWWRRADRRAPASREPRVERGADGGLVLVDPRGERWTVFDRRGPADRRGAPRPPLHRVFVNGAGERWEFALSADGAPGAHDAEPPSPDTLQRQLERATRV